MEQLSDAELMRIAVGGQRADVTPGLQPPKFLILNPS
jgi:hypothetical protein